MFASSNSDPRKNGEYICFAQSTVLPATVCCIPSVFLPPKLETENHRISKGLERTGHFHGAYVRSIFIIGGVGGTAPVDGTSDFASIVANTFFLIVDSLRRESVDVAHAAAGALAV